MLLTCVYLCLHLARLGRQGENEREVVTRGDDTIATDDAAVRIARNRNPAAAVEDDRRRALEVLRNARTAAPLVHQPRDLLHDV